MATAALVDVLVSNVLPALRSPSRCWGLANGSVTVGITRPGTSPLVATVASAVTLLD